MTQLVLCFGGDLPSRWGYISGLDRHCDTSFLSRLLYTIERGQKFEGYYFGQCFFNMYKSVLSFFQLLVQTGKTQGQALKARGH